jgi:competence ComEA-like helix-hairpin-helix protein
LIGEASGRRTSAPWLAATDQRTIGAFVGAGWLMLAVWLALSGWVPWDERGGEPTSQPRRPADGLQYQVDVNAAAWQEWALLPGIGETTAKRIVEYRERTGRFARLDDLRRVRGIGPKTLERLRPYLLLEPPSRATAGFTDHARFGQETLPWTSSSPANSSHPATSPKRSPL